MKFSTEVGGYNAYNNAYKNKWEGVVASSKLQYVITLEKGVLRTRNDLYHIFYVGHYY